MPRLFTAVLRRTAPTAVLATALVLALAGGAHATPRPATYIVQLHDDVGLAEGRAIVRTAHGRVTGRLPIINGLAVRLTRGQRAALVRDHRIEAVTRDARLRPQDYRHTEPAESDDTQDTGVTADPADAGVTADTADPADAGVTADTADPADAGATADTEETPDAGVTSDADLVPETESAPEPQVAPEADQESPFDLSHLATAYPHSVLAPQAWSTATGKGIGVAIIDTGVDGSLPDFLARDGSSRVVASVVTNPDARTPTDGYGHGTHVAGIIAGDGTRRATEDPAAGKYIGIAPDANLIAIKASDDEGRGTVLDAIYGLQFAVDHKADYNIRVVNLSVSSTAPQSYRTDPLDAAVESAYFHGVLVVAAVGNRGSVEDATAYAPGNDPFALSVGAVDDQGTTARGDDAFADWSSVGVTQDGFTKPDVGAPGAHIVSTLATGSAFADMCPTCVVDDNYIRVGGSSMAAPVVAGAAALILEAHPDWTPDEVKSTLIDTARNIDGGVDEVNVVAALSAETPASGANAGVVPNDLVDAPTGEIDYTRSSWGHSSWGAAPETLDADWARSSWGCTCVSSETGVVDQTRSSWGSATWLSRWAY